MAAVTTVLIHRRRDGAHARCHIRDGRDYCEGAHVYDGCARSIGHIRLAPSGLNTTPCGLVPVATVTVATTAFRSVSMTDRVFEFKFAT